jgi:hypothetical protein
MWGRLGVEQNYWSLHSRTDSGTDGTGEGNLSLC